MTEEKRAYRYRVVETGGRGTEAVGDSQFIVDWKYLGKEYTWNIVQGPPDFKTVGFIHGEYVDRGYKVDGKYETDAERKERRAAA